MDHFWETGVLNPDSNVQFGEGGAGTFSDGKLNTLVKDKNGRNRFVLETFVKFGAAEDILYGMGWEKKREKNQAQTEEKPVLSPEETVIYPD